MKSLLLALQFLTIIPLKIKGFDEQRLAKSMAYFPLIGLFLGLVLIAVNRLLLGLNFPALSINIILVISFAALTGGMHLDGLADTADALLSGKNKEEMLAIMRDSRIGAMGVLSLISAVLLKIALLSCLGNASKEAALTLMCVLSRWSLVFTVFLFPYARKEGKAKAFTSGINSGIFTLSTIIAAACAFGVWRIRGAAIFIIITAASYIAGKFISSKLGGISGDTLGALNESNEIVTLLSGAILAKLYL